MKQTPLCIRLPPFSQKIPNFKMLVLVYRHDTSRHNIYSINSTSHKITILHLDKNGFIFYLYPGEISFIKI